MSRLRKDLGQHIKRARRAAGYKSARAFAEAIGISESSVANAEIGSDRVGAGVYMDIESGLGWPMNSIKEALKTRDFSALQPHATREDDLYRRVINRNDEFELQVWALDDLPESARWDAIFAHRLRWSRGEQREAR